MFEKLKYFLAASLLVAVGGGSVACDDDDATPDEWSSDYVYLGQLKPAVRSTSFNVSHSSLGVAGETEIWMPVAVRLSHPRKSDVTVTLSSAVEGGMPAGDVVFREGGTVVIPAGETVARDTVDVLTDWSFVAKGKETYRVTVGIGSVKPASGDLRVSSKQSSLSLSVDKAVFADIIAGERPAGSRMDRSGWEVSWIDQEGSENWKVSGNLTDGDDWSYLFFGKPYMGIKIDMGSVRTITGLETYSAYGNGYAMTSCGIAASEDGTDWTLVTPDDRLAVSAAATQYVSFVVPVTARYIIWHFYGSSVLSSEVYAYQK